MAQSDRQPLVSADWFSGPKPKVRDLGVFAASSMSTREWIDRQTHDSPRMKKEAKARPAKKAKMTALVAAAGTPRAAAGRAAMLQQQIDRGPHEFIRDKMREERRNAKRSAQKAARPCPKKG